MPDSSLASSVTLPPKLAWTCQYCRPWAPVQVEAPSEDTWAVPSGTGTLLPGPRASSSPGLCLPSSSVESGELDCRGAPSFGPSVLHLTGATYMLARVPGHCALFLAPGISVRCFLEEGDSGFYRMLHRPIGVTGERCCQWKLVAVLPW